MKTNNNSQKFSEAFYNKINLPTICDQAILSCCTKAETIDLFKYLDHSPEPETLSIEIHAVHPEGEGDASYPVGYVLTEHWFGWIWYCETIKEVQQIVEDFKSYAKKQIPIGWNWIKILEPED